MTSKFKLGQIVCTYGIDDNMEMDCDFRTFVMRSLRYFKQCNWGDTCDEDKKLNDKAVKNGDERILAVYTYPKTKEKIWIVTEADRSTTTVLFPSEY